MRRKAIILLTATWLLLGMSLLPGSGLGASPDTATLKSVALSAGPTGTEVVLRVDGDYTYKTDQASPDTLFIDLAGARAEGMARSQEWTNPAISGYRLLSYKDSAGQPVVRVQVNTKQATPFVVQKDGAKLRLIYGKDIPASPVAAKVPAIAPPQHAAHPALPASVSNGPLLVSQVAFDKQSSGETFVNVSTSRTATYRVMTLASPARLVVDIDGAQNASPQKEYTADTAVLKSVRVGQFRAKEPSVVRVVADLNGNPAFDVHAVPGGVRIELRLRNLTASASRVEPKVEPKTELKTEVINSNPAVVPPVHAEMREAVKADVQSTLPAMAISKQAVAAPAPPPASVTPEALRAEHAAQILTASKENAPMAAQGAPPAVNPPGPAPAAVNPEDVRPVYTGEPISLNLKDVDLKDFFRLIHEISGLNIVIDPNVSGSVTMVLDSVPWDQALDIVLKNERLGKVMEGNVLRIAKIETLTAEQEGQLKLAAARMDMAPLVTVFRPINYAKAVDIATLLKTWAGGGALSRRGTVLVDTRANTLIISDVQAHIPIIENIVDKIDRKAKQVSIEARVVLATADFTRTLAASLLGGFVNSHTSGTGATGTGSAVTIPVPTGGIGGLVKPVTTVTPSTASGFGVAAITNVGANYFINASISAAEERDQAKTISRPTIVTQNNIQGTVQQGVQVPIQTSINNTISVQYVNATLQLTVTPQVTDDDNIFLVIAVQNNSVGASISGIGPEIATQQATTQVLVPDGGTVIFGGITVTNRSKSATYVPLLGNIPVLGHLFKTSNVADQDQELLFFVTPKVIGT